MHWTYCERSSDDDLCQGDILLPTRALRKLLGEVHPHFCADKYTGFMVLTQSCDLVRRKGQPPKCQYISISVIRPMQSVLPRLISEVCKPVGANLFDQGDKERANQLVERILNQNEQAQGLFYLHPESSVGIGEACISFLRVSIALRRDHYNALMAARRGGLIAEFQHKLGWLLGAIYSRVGTMDWGDHVKASEFQRMVKDLLATDVAGMSSLQWIPSDVVRRIRSSGLNVDGLTEAELARKLEELAPEPKRDILIRALSKELEKVDGMDSTAIEKVSNRVKNNSEIAQLLRG